MMLCSALTTLCSSAAAQPAIARFWLVDAQSNSRIEPLADYQALYLPFLPEELSIEAEANDETESVVLRIGAEISSQENFEPYALAGDASGDFVPVPELREEGWFTVSARPFAADGAMGDSGPEVSITIYRYQPDFIVTSTADIGDANPGDGRCAAWGIDFTAGRAAASSSSRGVSSSASRFIDRIDWLDLFFPRPNWNVLVRSGCTLRAAIEEANALEGRQSIVIDSSKGDYALRRGQISITDGMTLQGYGRRALIDAQGASRAFMVDGQGDGMVVHMRNLEVSRGESEESRGGALYIHNQAHVNLFDSVIRDSHGNMGGAIYLQDGGDLDMRRSALYGNVAGHPDTFGGGGLTQRGGAICSIGGNVRIADSSIYDNRAVRGGGVSNFGGTMRIENTSVIDNQAAAIGGGIENHDSSGDSGVLHLSFATIAHNRAGTSAAAPDTQRGGGGLYNSGTAFIASSILAMNEDAWYPGDERHAPDCYSPTLYDFTSFHNDVVGVLNENCSLTNYSTGDGRFLEHGTEDDPLDPRFTVRLSDSAYAYYNIQSTSVALDAAASTEARFYRCPDHDMRDRPRPVGEGCDIGAIERQ